MTNFVRLASAIGLGLLLAGCGGAAPPSAAPASAPASAPAAAASKPAPPAASNAASSAASAKPAASAVASNPAPSAKPAASGPANSLDDPSLVPLIDAAKKEGKLYAYSAANPAVMAHTVDAFKLRYPGIEVETLRLVGNQLVQRYAADAQANNVVADVLWSSQRQFFEQATKENWIVKITDDLPSLRPWPKEFWTGSFAMTGFQPWTLDYNTELVKSSEVPKSWEDVIQPRWKGQMLMLDPRNDSELLGWLLLLDQTYGDDFLRKLGGQDTRLVTSTQPGSQEVVAGSAQVLIPSLHSSIVDLVSKKAPIDETVLAPVTGSEQNIAVSTKAPHPNAARLFLNFVLSAEHQTARFQDGYASVLPDLPGAPKLPAAYKPPDVNGALSNQQRLLDLLNIHT